MKAWGLVEGEPVQLYTLTNAKGMRAEISNYGGIIKNLLVPDREGNMEDVVLGFNSLDEYLEPEHSPYFGCIIGRVGNRIARGRFTLTGKIYELATNNLPNGCPCHLHGGMKGFDKVVWKAERNDVGGVQSLRLSYRSKDGEEGYPGNLDVTTVYSLTDDNGLKIQYSAVTDAPTPVNLTNHTYFNLKGEGNGDILDHQVMIGASTFTPVDRGLIPTGILRPVAGTPFDFWTPHAIAKRIDTQDEQLSIAGGYDHNWALDGQGGVLALAARVAEPTTGRVMEVLTTEPGLQFYVGNFLPKQGNAKQLIGKTGKPYHYRGGLCLETQHYPDSPNQPTFPTVILDPGSAYQSTTIYRFSAN
jgi:aldose 1-epimerase